MSHSRFLAFLLPSLVLIVSCHTSRKAVGPKYRMLDTVTVSAHNNPMDIYRATSPRVWDIIHTDVALSFNLEERTATGTAKLTLQPITVAPDTLILDAKGMLIQSVGFDKPGTAGTTNLPYRYENDQLKISVAGMPWGTLSNPFSQQIIVHYISRPYAVAEAGGSAAITEDRGLYFINTDHSVPGKPVQIWTQGETESNSHWLPTIDKPNQRTTLDIALTVPDSMQTLSNGRLISSQPAGAGFRLDKWKMDKPIQVYAIMFAIGHFDIAKDNWRSADGQDHEVSYYTEPAYAPYAREMFKYTPDMIEFFSHATGVSYPWNKYNQVVVRDYVSGAMENTTASLFGEFMNQNFRQLADASTEDIVSHELFHQWFGDYVTAESWSNLTLNESFATYGEQLWRRHKYGVQSSDELAYGDLQRYLSATERNDPPLVRFYYRDREEMFDRISYQKGGSILHYINTIIGDTLFNRAMQIYLRTNALHAAEATQWRLAIEEATGRDWTQFFSQWYYHGGHPVLRVHYAYDDAAGQLKVTVRQKSSPDTAFKYNLPIRTAVITGSDIHMEDWAISERSHTFTYPYKGGKRPVIIPDAPHGLPGVIIEDKAPAQWLVQLTQSGNYTSKRLAINGANAAVTDPVSLTIMEQGLQDSMASIREYTLQQLARVTKQTWREALTPKIKYILQTEGTNKVRAAALATMGTWEEKSALPQIVEAISDSSYLVAGSALDALMNIDDDSAYRIAQKLIDASPKGYLMYVTWTAIVGKGNPSDIVRFEAKAPYVYGSTKTAFAGNMQKYALAVKDDSLYARTLRLLVSMARSENIRSYRYSIGSQVFELRESYKQDAVKKPKESEHAKLRAKITETYTTQLLSDEKDPANIKLYKEFDK